MLLNTTAGTSGGHINSVLKRHRYTCVRDKESKREMEEMQSERVQRVWNSSEALAEGFSYLDLAGFEVLVCHQFFRERDGGETEQKSVVRLFLVTKRLEWAQSRSTHITDSWLYVS